MRYVEGWRAKGYNVTAVEKSRFMTAYTQQATIMRFAGEKKENVVRRMAQLSREISGRQARDIKKWVKEATGEELTLEEIKGMTAGEGFSLLAPPGSDTEDYRYAESIFYPEKAQRRVENMGKTRQEINAARAQARAEHQSARAEYERTHKVK